MKTGFSEEAERLAGELAEDRELRRERNRSEGRDSSESDLFTEQVAEILVDAGAIPQLILHQMERASGNSTARIDGYEVDEDEKRLDLLATLHAGPGSTATIPRAEVERVARSALRMVAVARRNGGTGHEGDSSEREILERIAAADFDTIRVTIVCDGLARDLTDHKGIRTKGESHRIELHVWDMERLARCVSSGRTRELIEVDFSSDFGGGLPCLPVDADGAHRSFLVVLGGKTLAKLYEDFGERLLELNVRSFLQARGKVNKGIRNSLLQEPSRFFSYNNGLSAVVQEARVERTADGVWNLVWVRGLQIVNGGQTTASIHRASHREGADLSRVFVQAKITVVDADEVELVVPQISRCSNNQNKVSDADFSANDPLHRELERLSRTVWAPGERTRWFYERARGQYQVARSREGVTPAAKTRFDDTHPPSQVFSKTEVAAFVHAWACLPHIVSRGAQKNFQEFMLKKTGVPEITDESFFRSLVARGIILKSCRRAAASAGIGAYRANIVVYTVALLAHRIGAQLDFKKIWQAQGISPALEDTIRSTFPAVERTIKRTAGARNVTEWCKNRECWEAVRQLNVEFPEERVPELL